MFAACACSAATKSLNTVCSTYTREHAEHFWPDNPNAERATPVAAIGSFAWRVTIAAFLPPISAMHGRGQCPPAKAADEMHADVVAPGERDARHVRVADQRLAERARPARSRS